MADDKRWKEPKAPEQDTNLFDLMGDAAGDGALPIKPKKPAEDGPKVTDKAAEKIKIHNESSSTSEATKLDPKKMKGTGKDGAITANDVQAEIGRQSRERAAAAAKAQAKTRDPNKKEPDEYDKERTVYYAGHQVPVPNRKMKLEEIRQMIEEQWPELSKENTDMVYDDERGAVIPVLKGHRKGAVKEVFLDADKADLDRPVSYVLAQDGYTYMVRRTQAGDFVTRIQGALSVREGFKLKVPFIPVELLREAIDRFQQYERMEVLCNFIWEATAGRYHLGWPDQHGDSSSVKAHGAMETDDHFIVLQMHSHGIMPAFFSSQDDADEVRTGLYAVVGHCDRMYPDMRLRYSNGGEFRDVKAETVFRFGWSAVVEDAHYGS